MKRKGIIYAASSILLIVITAICLLPLSAQAEGEATSSGYLADLAFRVQLNTQDIENYILTPEFDGVPGSYDVYLRDYASSSMNSLSVTAPLSDDAPAGCAVFAVYDDADGVARDIEIGNDYTLLTQPFTATAKISEIEFQVRSDTDVLQSYTVNFKYTCTLHNLKVEDSNGNLRPLDQAVTYDTLNYAADVPISVDNVKISVSTQGNHTVTINEADGDKLTLLQQDMVWDGNGEMDIPIAISHEGYESATYTLTLERVDVDYYPEIISQPVAANYTQFDDAEPLVFEVQTPDTGGGTLTFQWYLGEMFPNAKDIIEGATSAIYTPPTDTVNMKPMMAPLKGNRWYKCVATNTVNGRAYATESAVVAIHLDAFQVAAPTISVDPAGGEYLQGDTPEPLYVEASSMDGGMLTYQWYSNTTESNQGGILIEGATDASYVPPAHMAGTLYYYCEVTNTVMTLTKSVVSATAAVNILPLSGETEWQGAGTEELPYLLEDADDLVLLKELVNQGYAMEQMAFQMNDAITLPVDWEPIGKLKDGVIDAGQGINILPFCGIFDGDGNTLTVPEDGLPLFNYVRNATIQNLNIYGTKIAGYGLINKYTVDYGSDGDYQTGVPKAVLIDNVTINSGSSILYSGFISGYASGGNTVTIRNCTVEDNVVIGYEKNRSAIGSFAGLLNGTINNSISYATVYGVNNVGGLVGVKGQSMGTCSVKNSAFCGEIVATGSRVGGIIGSGYDGSGTAPNTPVVTVINCYVAADITGEDEIGGILGSEPGCECCWNNGVGSVSNNHFYGNITAINTDAVTGGIVGFLKSFDKYQGIDNNYYLDTCGAQSGIGDIETIITTDHNKYGEEFGIDYTFDADEFCIAFTGEHFADGTVTELLNTGENSTGNWLQGEDYPYFTDDPVLVDIDLSGSYKTSYHLGDSFSSVGMIVTATYSNGNTVTVALGEVTFTGFDSDTKGVKTVTVHYLNTETSYTIRVVSGGTGNISVSFTLLGAPDDGKNGTVNTLRRGNLDTWIEEEDYIVSVDATVRDVFEKALTQADLTWSNPSGNYVESITKDGVTLEQFTNGEYSGWMYTLNGEHPLLGIDEQYLDDSDDIVFHYTDDYTMEEGSQSWGGGSSGGTKQGSSSIFATTNVKNGKASALVSKDDIDSAITAAAKADVKNITISATTYKTITSSTVALPDGAVSDIAGAGLSVKIETSTGTFDMDNDALQAIAGKGNGSAIFSAEQLDTNDLSDTNKALVGDHPVFDLSITVGGANVTDFGGGTVKVSLPYMPEDGEDTNNLTIFYINANGKAVEMMDAYYDAETGSIIFDTEHFSIFAVVYYETSSFADVSEDGWYYESVKYAVNNGLFQGTSAKIFEPDTVMTRAMLVTVLYRLDGEPAVMAANGFTDVKNSAWYTDAVTWASQNDIVSGYGNGLFGTNDAITREQLATILYNYANYQGYSVADTAQLDAYTDSGEISVWAEIPFAWAVGEGLINGMPDTTLEPSGSATRAQVSMILMRFCENIMN